VADAAIRDAVGSLPPQRCPYLPRHRIVVRVVHPRIDPRVLPEVVQLRVDMHVVEPHRQVHGSLPGRGEKTAVVVARLGDRGRPLPAGVEDAIAAVGEAAAVGIEVGEGSHDGAGTRTEDPVVCRYQFDGADLVAHAVVGHRLQRIKGLEISRVRDPIEEEHARIAGRHDPERRVPADSADRYFGSGHDQPPPLTASR
jgi:hypothetical protein